MGGFKQIKLIGEEQCSNGDTVRQIIALSVHCFANNVWRRRDDEVELQQAFGQSEWVFWSLGSHEAPASVVPYQIDTGSLQQCGNLGGGSGPSQGHCAGGNFETVVTIARQDGERLGELCTVDGGRGDNRKDKTRVSYAFNSLRRGRASRSDCDESRRNPIFSAFQGYLKRPLSEFLLWRDHSIAGFCLHSFINCNYKCVY
jgi:hypothetical protein